jgi:hypothetical protein
MKLNKSSGRTLMYIVTWSTLASLLSVTFGPPAHSSPLVLDRKFANCAALNKVYPGGVAKNKKVRNKGGATKYTPSVKPKIYKANASKDRDKDGIACER